MGHAHNPRARPFLRQCFLLAGHDQDCQVHVRLHKRNPHRMLRALSERLLAIYSPFSSGTTPAEDFTVLKDSLRVEDLSMYRSLAPAPPPMNHFVEAAADTSCAKLAMGPVSQEDCSAACTALGFKSTGPKARANISGCFVLTSGPFEGTCILLYTWRSIGVSLCGLY